MKLISLSANVKIGSLFITILLGYKTTLFCCESQQSLQIIDREKKKRATLYYIPKLTLPKRLENIQKHQGSLFALSSRENNFSLHNIIIRYALQSETNKSYKNTMLTKLGKRLCKDDSHLPYLWSIEEIGSIIGSFLSEYVALYLQEQAFKPPVLLKVPAYIVPKKFVDTQGVALILKSHLQNAIAKHLQLNEFNTIIIPEARNFLERSDNTTSFASSYLSSLPSVLVGFQYNKFSDIQVTFTKDYEITPPFSLSLRRNGTIIRITLKGVKLEERDLSIIDFMKTRITFPQKNIIITYCAWCSRYACSKTPIMWHFQSYRSAEVKQICHMVDCPALPKKPTAEGLYSKTPRIFLDVYKS